MHRACGYCAFVYARPPRPPPTPALLPGALPLLCAHCRQEVQAGAEGWQLHVSQGTDEEGWRYAASWVTRWGGPLID